MAVTSVEDAVLHAGFLAQAEKQPDCVALVWSGGSMTYGDLASSAGHLAGRLRALGVEPNDLIGVSVAKGWQQVVAVLGVLMAGGAYLPIDPGLPDERRHYLVEHGEVRVVVTADEEIGRWPTSVAQVAAIADDTTVPGDPPAQPPQAPTDLAYVMYTSGSTGTPKGVAITHRAAWNTIRNINDRFEVGPADRVLCLSSLSFDLSVYDLFGLLAAGGAIVLPDSDAARDPRHWLELCEAHRVTIWNSVPALMEMSVEQAEVGPPISSTLRLVLLSGDWIPVGLIDRIRGAAQAAQVVSLGGATEAAIWSIFYPLDQVDPMWKSIPYGKPLGNQFWEVLNERLEPCPVHVPGHLYIGGAGLAECYWRDEERTAASFIRHPRSGERLYRTGDLGRYLPDGNIEFLGREDAQVKIGGYRIELGEIEAHLATHPQVRAGAIAAVGEPRGHRRLVAYVVPAGAEPTAGSASTLPSGMAPEPAPVIAQDIPTAVVDATAIGEAIEIVVDPLEQLEFKLRRHGHRRLEDGGKVELASVTSTEERELLHGARGSHRSFGSGAVSFESLSALLETLRPTATQGLPKYRYGSAGALYPVQVYVGVRPQRVRGVAAGTYYYDPDAHALRAIAPDASLETGVHVSTNEQLAAQSAFTIVLVAELNAIEPLYGPQARHFCVIEAGLIAQLLEMEASRAGIGLCQVALGDTPSLREALALTESHAVLHGLVGGHPDHEVRPELSAAISGHDELWEELRAWLTTRLPHYMIPGEFVAIEQMPLSANGKVDRGALPALGPVLTGVPVADGPQGDAGVGETLATEALRLQLLAAPAEERWELVLESVRATVATVLGDVTLAIQPDKRFVELGFDSLQAIQVRNRLESATGVSLPATLIFDYPTTKLVAERVMETLVGAVDGGTVSAEYELAEIEQRLRTLASAEPLGPNVASRLRALINALSGEGQDAAAAESDLTEATAENVLELIDRELGGS